MNPETEKIPSRSLGQVIILGLPETAPALAEHIARLPGGPVVRGVVLVRTDSAEGRPPDGAGADPGRRGPAILGVERDLPLLHARYGFDSAIVTLPVAMPVAADRVRRTLESLGVRALEHPPIQDSLLGVSAGTPRVLDLAALVGRSPRPIDPRLARRAVAGRRVAVTGAGGSIGSELCRIVAAFEPAELLLIERSENALFEIDREIASRFGAVPRRALLHDVVDEPATHALFTRRRPEVVFHAAAHKHVPMLEDHAAHAVNNNVFGTTSVADAAVAAGADRFVLISTDKAVNPSSVMGATKRFAELYVRSLAGSSATRCAMVRFGNVLGSSGSVLTVWANQIAAGKPVTITDARMTRYFMTIPEAAALVVQTAGLTDTEAADADVFVLDMGQPVRIVALAERFIRAHGLRPIGASGEDDGGLAPAHPLMVTGIRPGEKIHEELAHAAEQLQPTVVNGVNAWSGAAHEPSETIEMMGDLAGVRHSLDEEAVLAVVRRWTPTLRAPDSRSDKRAVQPA